MSEYIQQRRCDGNAGLASIRERRMQRGGPGLFSGKRARGFTTRGTQGRKIRTCSYGRPLYDSDILKIEARVAPIFFLRASRPSWRTRRGRDDQDKARRHQEMESISTILFNELKLAICREARILRHELTDSELRIRFWTTVMEVGSSQDGEDYVLVGLRCGQGNEF